MISGAEISIVIQGPVVGRPDDPPEQQITRRAITELREFWPGCEIVLSTWPGQPTIGLGCDLILENPDPGAVALNDGTQRHVLNNLNRQIVSTRNGLARATRPRAIKLRSDSRLSRPIDFSFLDRPHRDPDWCVLKQPVLALNFATRHPLRRPVLFHLSDIFFAGLRQDLETLWNIPLVEEPGFTRAIDPARRPAINAFPEADYRFRCAPEQYLGEQLARRKLPQLRLRHPADGSIGNLFAWLRLLGSNFAVQTATELGLVLPAHLARLENWWDLVRPGDQSWLGQWSSARVPLATRLFAASRFRLLQQAYYRSSPHSQPVWQRGLRRAIRSTV